MTNEEVKVVLKSLADNPLLSAEHITKALYKAIELVESQPCEDCYYNDGDVHAECVVCDIPVEKVAEAFINDVESVKDQLDGQPCEDAVSRQKVLQCIKESREGIDWGQSEDEDAFLHYSAALYRTIASKECLPSVTPKYTDEEIQKMQELEQAQLEKAYELGMQTSFEEWLSSFNTESATCCFTAVQQLKKKLDERKD